MESSTTIYEEKAAALRAEEVARRVRERELFNKMRKEMKMLIRRENFSKHLPHLHEQKENLKLVNRTTPPTEEEIKVGVMIHIIHPRIYDEVENEIKREKKAIEKRRRSARCYLKKNNEN